VESPILRRWIAGPKIPQGEDGPGGQKLLTRFANENQAIALRLNVVDLDFEGSESRTTVTGLIEKLPNILTVEPARNEGIARDGYTQAGSLGVVRLQPLQEVVGLVRKRAHFARGDVEQVVRIQGAVSNTGSERACLVGYQYLQPRSNSGEVNGDHRTGKTSPNDGYIILATGGGQHNIGKRRNCERSAKLDWLLAMFQSATT